MSTKLINQYISNCVLTVGPEYKNSKGGIGSLLEKYSQYFTVFNFIPTHKRQLKLLVLFYSIKQLFQVFKALCFNLNLRIIHLHCATRGSFIRKYILFFLGKYFLKKKVILHIHSGEFITFYQQSNLLLKYFIKHLVTKADILICLTNSWKVTFKATFGLNDVISLPNLVDKASELSLIQKKTKISNKTTFLFLGIIKEKKGIFDLIEATAILKNLYPDQFEVLIGGEGESTKLTQLINKYNLTDCIKRLGWIKEEQKHDTLINSDVYILPSYFEGLPMSILEAMSFGMPVIASNVGGIPEIVLDNENGYLIVPGEINELAKKMAAFLDNPTLIKSMGYNSLNRIKEYYPESVFLQLEGIYKSLLK
ncbi:glycosyltransferase family 4 protein [Adhaeribacter terreus]|uniref:Glycosyltransferase family 4 protein n=1 Tax=Adhaeribacter terreus TaxID=529703 RepID=A0ABW0EB45_9BACT